MPGRSGTSAGDPFRLDPELGGFASMYGACREGIVAVAHQKENEEGRALRLGWPVLIAIARARETYYGIPDIPFGQIKTGVFAAVVSAFAELPLHEYEGESLEPEPPPPVGEGRLDREVAAILATWELEGRYGEYVALSEAELRTIGAPYVTDAIARMRHVAAADPPPR